VHGLSNVAIDEFRENGFFILRDAVTHDRKVALLTTIRVLIVAQGLRHGAVSENEAAAARRMDDECFFGTFADEIDQRCHAVIQSVYETIPGIVAAHGVFHDPGLVSVAASLLGVEAHHLFVNSTYVRIDPPRPAPFRLDWHQESSYTESRAPMVQFWSPLLWPSSVENGGIEVAVGSHRQGTLDVPADSSAGSGARQYRVPDAVVDTHDVLMVEIAPGEAVFFSGDLVHRSSNPSRQERMRYSAIGRFSDATSPLFSPFGRLSELGRPANETA